MRKIYSIISATTLLLAAASSASAAGPSKIDLCGQYSFSAAVDFTDQAFESTLKVQFDFDIYTDDANSGAGGVSGTGPLAVKPFLIADNGPFYITYNPSNGIFDFRNTNLGQINGTPLAFRDASSRYEELAWTIDVDGKVSCPDFNVINAASGVVVASYSNVEIIKTGNNNGGGDKEENKIFVGTHTIPGWWIADYSKGDGTSFTVTSGNDVSISINDKYQYTSVAGFNVSQFLLDGDYDTGEINGNTWTVDLTPFGACLDLDYETGAGKFISGPLRRNQSAPDFNSTLRLTYDEASQTWKLSDFTIWDKIIVNTGGDVDDEGNVSGETEVVWKLLYYYSTSEISGEGGSNEPVDDNADASIIGTWTFAFNGHYIGNQSLGKFTDTFEAELKGSTVTFTGTDRYHIIAEFVNPTTLSFKQVPVGNPAQYTLYQSPYVNTTGTNELEDLTMQEFTAQYDAEAGEIIFPANSGLRYGFFNPQGELSYWDDAFDFVTATRLSDTTPASLAIDGEIEASSDDSILYVTFRYTAINTGDATITAYLTETDPANNLGAPVNSNPASLTFYNIKPGTYNYTVTLKAENGLGETIAQSEGVPFTIVITDSGIDGINADMLPARYFNLQGVEVANPENGIFIRVQGNKAAKVRL